MRGRLIADSGFPCHSWEYADELWRLRLHRFGSLLQGIIPLLVLQQLQRYALVEHMDRLSRPCIRSQN